MRPSAAQRLDHQQLPAFHRRMLTVAVACPMTVPVHDTSSLRPRPSRVNRDYFPKIRRSSIIEQRRSRVNVSGVVTPSPVGPAIENDM